MVEEEPCCGPEVTGDTAGDVACGKVAAVVGCNIEEIILGLLSNKNAPPRTTAPPRIQPVGIENLRATRDRRVALLYKASRKYVEVRLYLS